MKSRSIIRRITPKLIMMKGKAWVWRLVTVIGGSSYRGLETGAESRSYNTAGEKWRENWKQ